MAMYSTVNVCIISLQNRESFGLVIEIFMTFANITGRHKHFCNRKQEAVYCLAKVLARCKI